MLLTIKSWMTRVAIAAITWGCQAPDNGGEGHGGGELGSDVVARSSAAGADGGSADGDEGAAAEPVDMATTAPTLPPLPPACAAAHDDERGNFDADRPGWRRFVDDPELRAFVVTGQGAPSAFSGEAWQVALRDDYLAGAVTGELPQTVRVDASDAVEVRLLVPDVRCDVRRHGVACPMRVYGPQAGLTVAGTIRIAAAVDGTTSLAFDLRAEIADCEGRQWATLVEVGTAALLDGPGSR